MLAPVVATKSANSTCKIREERASAVRAPIKPPAIPNNPTRIPRRQSV